MIREKIKVIVFRIHINGKEKYLMAGVASLFLDTFANL